MSLGRNDPCHCGSGKKYKKCCLSKDQEAALEKLAKPERAPAKALTPPKFTPPSNPRMDAWNARWEEFDQADYEARLALFDQTLNEPELMDEEMVFEMTRQLFEQTIEHDERDRFDALLEALRERLPAVYENEAYNLLDWRIYNALARGQVELAGELTRAYAGLIHEHIDNWKWIENRMAYHGQVAALAETMRKAWPQVRHSTEILPWGVDEFFSRALNYELLDYVATHSSPSVDDPELLERMKFYGDEIITERLAESLACVTGQMQRQWRLDDFQQRNRQD